MVKKFQIYRLRQARDERELTQEQVAEKLSTTAVSISRYETGYRMPSGPTLHALASVYGKPVEWFFGEDETSQVELDEDDARYMEDLDLIMSEPELMLRTLKPELSDEAIRSIADFIRFVHEREERERRERPTTG